MILFPRWLAFLLGILLGIWIAFHLPETTRGLTTFKNWTVRRVTGQLDCPENYKCEKVTADGN